MGFFEILNMMWKGIGISVEIFFVTLIGGLALGLLLCLLRMSRLKLIQLLTKFYISVMRGTPLMLQLFVVYFGQYYLLGIKISSGYKLTAVLIGFVLNYAAYFAEIYRAGIEAIPIGQYEAAQILGYTKAQTFLYIVMPQVVKHIVPPITNETITLVKDTSLAFALSVAEMFTIAKQLAASTTSMVPFVVAAVVYYIFNLVVAVLAERLEKKLSYYR